jgi:putative ABC transport system permease protein
MAPIRTFRIKSRDGRRISAEMLEEIDAHIALCVDYLVARGVALDVAQRQARERFGDYEAARITLPTSAKRREGRMRNREWVQIVRQDLAYAVRQARRELGTTLAIVGTLALGVGANVVMFGIVDRLLLSPPPGIADADQVVRPWFDRFTKVFGHAAGYQTNWVTYQALTGVQGFSGIAAYQHPRDASVGRGPDAQPIQLTPASASLFSVLGVRPELGRFYTADEDRPPAGAPVAVVSHAYFAKHPDVFARPLLVGGKQLYTVIGVAPEGFTGAELSTTDIWVPLTAVMNSDYGGPDYVGDKGSANLWTVARLRTDAPPEQTAAEATVLYTAHLDTVFTLRTPAPRVLLTSIVPARGPHPRATATVASWLLGVAMVVLLIACANVATLLLVRAIRRNGEIAVRLSLGISRRRLIAQLTVESLFLVSLATVIAVVISRAVHDLIYGVFLPEAAATTAPSWHLAALIAAVAVVTTVLTTLAPMIYASSVDLVSSLKSAGRQAGGTRSRLRFTLTVVQIALSVVLLVGAALFVRSLQNIRAVPLGLDLDRLVYVRVQPPATAASPASSPSTAAGLAERDLFFKEAKHRLAALPSVESATITVDAPFRGSSVVIIRIPGHDLPRATSGGPYVNVVDADFFTTLGTRVTRGRGFTAADLVSPAQVVIVNRSFAAAVWGEDKALGGCIRIGDDTTPCMTIVGVVEDIHRNGVVEPPQLQYYVPLASASDAAMIVRARDGNVQRTINDVRRTLQGMSKELPYPVVTSMSSLVDSELASWRLGARMFSLFGGLAFVVAFVGFAGLLAHNVAQRRHEIGVRSALGATLSDILVLVVGDGLRVMAVGLGAGLVLAAVLAPRLRPLLFGIGPRDAAIYVAIALAIGPLSLLATILPARRAASVDPMEALRGE